MFKYTFTTLESKEEKYFDTRKEAMEYLNNQVKVLRNEIKGLKVYFLNNSKYFYEKELRPSKLIEMEENNEIDLGEDGKYPFYSFEIDDLTE